jgi:benzoyl-CoA reductase/2-hydroxyglutaryl-CoA dehydratase subunit BcrC/BadD/HgdB
MKTIKKRNNQKKTKTKKNFLYNPNNPKKSFDVYIDKNPKDTINIKYATTEDVKNTIDKLEKLYKDRKYTHKRIWQVGMIMKVRLEVLKNKKPEQYNISKKYFEFLGKRTKLDNKERYNSVFKY